MLNGVYVQFSGALLFSMVFLFLWKQSGVVYFGYWSLAWAVESAAWVCTLLGQVTGSPHWRLPHAFFEFGFALSLVAAARVSSERASSERVSHWRTAMRALYIFPAFLLLVELAGPNQSNVDAALRSVILSAIYLYSFRQLSFGTRRLFHFTLLALSLFYLQDAADYLIVFLRGGLTPAWMEYMKYSSYYDLALKTLLAFSAMAMWIENQNNRVLQIGMELDKFRRERANESNLDYLTGLLNQDALRRRMDSDESFEGVAVVFDLDGFKSINDVYGHIVGDEVLRNVGNLVRSSIRDEDQAYRWGGDEFALLFNSHAAEIALKRMAEIEARLNDFRVRGHGLLRVHFSWGVVEGQQTRLRDVIDKADRLMYVHKRERAAGSGAEAIAHP
ncbi:GGDEF domain-containing protein [Nevskia soli]|jgi:diguanylate cyclase (GGDEF)-like protein|uniref:GGDEF domain-containing protein n=1 Tax=Nevskia soli TaxID=418856 RepID=UPI001C5CBF62|nr:GGDEF domain-containing protein [Nevskia soli]